MQNVNSWSNYVELFTYHAAVLRFLANIILFLVLLHSSESFAQSKAKIEAKKELETLKEGVLLIKLYDYQSKIDKLRENGYDKKANQIQQESDSLNKVIVKAFTTLYEFSDFGFYMSSNESLLKQGDFSHVYFLSGVDTISSHSDIFYLDSKYVFFESMQSSQLGFSLFDKDFNLLKEPFPYYVRKRQSIFFLRRDHFEMTLKLQENLNKFWDKSRKY